MKSTLLRSTALCALVMLGACGGSGGGGPSPMPPPVPAPPPPPPPPPPSPTYSSMPVTAPASFDAITVTRTYTGFKGTASEPVAIQSTKVSGISSDFVVAYDPVQKSYSVTTPLQSSTFEATEQIGLSDFYDQRSDTNGNFALLVAYRNMSDGKNALPFTLSYMSYGIWSGFNVGVTGTKQDSYYVVGFPTVGTDMPRTGSATYTASAFGEYLITGGSLPEGNGIGGSASFSANFGAGTVSTQINLTQTNLAFIDLLGTGTITSGTSAFNGSLTGTYVPTKDPLKGDFAGNFFGPAAAEMGYSFDATGHLSDGRDLNLIGLGLGKKQ